MKLFIDSCDVDLITKYKELGIVDGVTTNPSIISKSGKDFEDIIKSICDIIDTSVSVEVIATNYDDMVKEGRNISKIGSQVTVKLPITYDGLKACHKLSQENIPVNMTLCFSATQALIAAKAGATYVSPFIGRLDDIGMDGLNLIAEICSIFENYPEINTQILAASIRNPLHIIEAGKLGADIATVPANMLDKMINNALTDKGLEIFLNDWNNYENTKK